MERYIFGLDQMGASIHNAFNFNGSIWAPTDQHFWTTYDKGIYNENKLELRETTQVINTPLLIETIESGATTTYPIVLGGGNSFIFSPVDDELWVLSEPLENVFEYTLIITDQLLD